MLTTTLNSNGKLTIPKKIRDGLAWPTGTVLSIEQHPQGVLLSPAKQYFPVTTVDELRGCVNYKGPALSLDDIEKKLAKVVSKQRLALASHKTVSI